MLKSAKSLLHTLYYYNGKLSGPHSGEHSNITVENFDVGLNFICFKEVEVEDMCGKACFSSF